MEYLVEIKKTKRLAFRTVLTMVTPHPPTPHHTTSQPRDLDMDLDRDLDRDLDHKDRNLDLDLDWD